MKKDRDHWIMQAAKSHTDLCLFNTIVSVVEGGGFSSNSQAEQFAVVQTCHRGMQKSLARMDRARRLAGGKVMES